MLDGTQLDLIYLIGVLSTFFDRGADPDPESSDEPAAPLEMAGDVCLLPGDSRLTEFTGAQPIDPGPP